MTVLFRRTIDTPEAAKELFEFLKKHAGPLAKAGHPLSVVVARHKSQRSLPQNARWWAAICDPVSRQVQVEGKSYSPETWAHYLKERFLPELCAKGIEKWAYMPDGTRQLQMGTSDLNTVEMAEFQTVVEAYCVTELGVDFTEEYHG